MEPGMKELMAKLLENTNVPWLEYADDYQSDCAFIYLWFENLDPDAKEGGAFFQAGLDAAPDYEQGSDVNWIDKKWQWVKFWDAALLMQGSGSSDRAAKGDDTDVESVIENLEAPIENKFIEFAKPWIDVKDVDALEEFHNKYWKDFKRAWITEIRKNAPTDEDIFGNIWNLDESPDPIDDIQEDDPEDQDEKEEIKPATKEKLLFGGSTAWVNEDDGEIKLSKNSPGEDWMLIESVNTGHTGDDGEILFVPSVLEGTIDWWTGIGNSDSDITRVSKTKIIIAGAGDYSKSWLRRYFFVKDKDGDLVISY